MNESNSTGRATCPAHGGDYHWTLDCPECVKDAHKRGMSIGTYYSRVRPMLRPAGVTAWCTLCGKSDHAEAACPTVTSGAQASQPMCEHVPRIRCVCNNGLNCPNAGAVAVGVGLQNLSEHDRNVMGVALYHLEHDEKAAGSTRDRAKALRAAMNADGVDVPAPCRDTYAGCAPECGPNNRCTSGVAGTLNDQGEKA